MTLCSIDCHDCVCRDDMNVNCNQANLAHHSAFCKLTTYPSPKEKCGNFNYATKHVNKNFKYSKHCLPNGQGRGFWARKSKMYEANGVTFFSHFPSWKLGSQGHITNRARQSFLLFSSWIRIRKDCNLDRATVSWYNQATGSIMSTAVSEVYLTGC